jgi:hypothetical protein
VPLGPQLRGVLPVQRLLEADDAIERASRRWLLDPNHLLQ